MKSFLALALAILPSIAYAECIDDGELTFKPFARDHVRETVCPGLKGTYAYSDGTLTNYKSVYMEVDQGTKCYYYNVFLLSEKTKATLSYEKCAEYFRDEIGGCDRGGQTEHDDTWRITLDPMASSCPPGVEHDKPVNNM